MVRGGREGTRVEGESLYLPAFPMLSFSSKKLNLGTYGIWKSGCGSWETYVLFLDPVFPFRSTISQTGEQSYRKI